MLGHESVMLRQNPEEIRDSIDSEAAYSSPYVHTSKAVRLFRQAQESDMKKSLIHMARTIGSAFSLEDKNASRDDLQAEAPPRSGFFPQRGWKLALLLVCLCTIAYLPALNNGFISDDYVMLEWAKTWQKDFSFLFKIVPDVFRLTTYIFLGLLQWMFGYRHEFYYGFTILVHTLNCVLLYWLIDRITGSRKVAVMAALFFAVVQSPQEAVMWVAAMACELGALCMLGTLLLWLRGRFIASALCYLIGLFSMESTLVTLLLLPLLEFFTQRKLTFRRGYWYFLVPTILFAVVFLTTISNNYQVTAGTYRFGAHGLWVLVVSLHRLMFPWLYLAVLLVAASRRQFSFGELKGPFLWMVITLLPFIFLTYMNHVPSRHTYVPAMGLVWALATQLSSLEMARLRQAFIVAFIAVNIGYIWLVKDAQFVERAAPTAQLLERMQRHPPGRLMITNFPLNPWIAKMATRLVPGWEPEMIFVNEQAGGCPDCLQLRWNVNAWSYDPVSWGK
jgi:hypothetical protein